jgi:hypothetical protein
MVGASGRYGHATVYAPVDVQDEELTITEPPRLASATYRSEIFGVANTDIDASCVQDWVWQCELVQGCPVPFPPDTSGNINCNPLFKNQAQGDLRLTPNSACIDKALNDLIDEDAGDLDNDDDEAEDTPLDFDLATRVVDGDFVGSAIVDMGAFELVPTCPADLTGDGIVDGADLGQLLLVFGQTCANMSCTACAADLTGDGLVDGADLGQLLLEFGQPCGGESLMGGGGGESMMGGESFGGDGADSLGGESSLDAALASLGFESAEQFAAWGQEAAPELLEFYGQLLSALLGE